jgi:glycosyltransferase involved in cell wall biosynthesis
MATYNGERWVGRQLETILPQLAADDELVVSDDASTDGTVALVEALVDPRVRLLTGRSFRSPVRNFEQALEHARGDLVVLSDQDDVWLPNKLEAVRAAFADPPRRPYLVVFDAAVVDEEERLVHPSVLAKLKAGPGFGKNLWTNRYLGCCMAFTADLLDAALPIPRRMPMHDMWLGQLCERIGGTAFLPERTMLYRRHDETTTGFEIEFRPLLQIRRRVDLAAALAARTLAYRRARSRGPSLPERRSRHPS